MNGNFWTSNNRNSVALNYNIVRIDYGLCLYRDEDT